MMNKLIVLTLIALFVGACSSVESKKETNSTWEPIMDQPSELASIMRSLNQEALLRKQNLENGELSEANSKLIFKMITAEPTEPHMVGPAFAPHTEAFIASYGQLSTAKDVDAQIDAHNNLVKSCVACHMNFCQGPIPRIEKLYVNL